MRRKLTRKPATGVSLFPFLAVLICTMGALIVLLVVVVKQSEAHARDHRDDAAKREYVVEQRLRQQLDDQAFLQETLASRRPAATKMLANGRMELSHLEAHILQLKKRAEAIEQQLVDFDQIESLRSQDRKGAQNELAQLQRQIRLAREQLADAKKRAASQPKSFSIIPTQGPNGTTRRPVYVECTGRGVILQPEGIVLRPSDFRDPIIPGNPLDAALLAVREFLVRNGVIADNEEPYPLLIVRPDGTEAYARARAAMKSWDDEFGYELIDGAKTLAYPEPVPGLAKTMQDAINLSRRRQAALAKAQPTRFGGGTGGIGIGEDDKVVLRPRPGGGGFIREGSGGSDPWFDGAKNNGGFGSNEFETNQSQKSDRGEQSNTDKNASGNASRSGPNNANDSATGGSSNVASFGVGQQNLANSRGRNWGLKNYSASARAYTRPIRVVCFADRIEIIPQLGTDERPYMIPFRGDTIKAVDKFVTSVHSHTESWGIAGRNAYWKPVLSVEVVRGGERRFAELESLLQGSGLEVRKKSGS